METITREEALKQGYTHGMKKDDTFVFELDDIGVDLNEREFVLCEKETKTFGLTSNMLSDWISDYIDNNEEYYSDNLMVCVDESKLEQCIKILNPMWDKQKFYAPTSIRVFN